MLIIVDQIENLLVDNGILLNSCLIHLIDEIMLEIIHTFSLLKFFELSLSGSIYVVPRVSALSVHLLSLDELLLIVVLESVTHDNLVRPEGRIVRF